MIPSAVRCSPTALLLLAAIGIAHAMDAKSFAEKLARAEALNTSAPWEESQAVLEELRPHLELASADQHADFVYLDARNLILAGRLDAALATLNDLLRRDVSPTRRVRLLRLAANAAILARHFEQSFALLNEALVLLEREQLSNDDGVYSLASYLYTQVGELERGQRYGELAVQVARSSGDVRLQCSAEARLAYVHKASGDLAAGATLYRQAIRHCLDAGDELIAGVTEAGLADLLRLQGESEQAETLLRQAVRRLEETGYASGLAEARLYWARLALEHGNGALVERLLEPALAHFAEVDNAEYLSEAREMLASLARNRGELAAALEHYDAYLAAREDYLDEKRARQLAYLEVEFDLKHTEQQLALLTEQARVGELELQASRQQARLTLAGYGLGVAVLLLLVLLLIQAKRDRRRFQRLSHRDGLTGVNNHTHFFALASQALAKSGSGVPFTMILGDIDHFKLVNDSYGHSTGDEVLRRIGARLRECFADRGVIGRIGGEEFAVALPRCALREAESLLDRFRARLEECRVDDVQVFPTMSFGIAQRLTPDETLAVLYDRADRALYRAKHAGRNRVVLAAAV